MGEDRYGVPSEISMLRPLTTSKLFPKLKILRLPYRFFTDDIIPDITTSEILKQLEVLDLSSGEVTDEGARVILENLENFTHLKMQH